MKYDYPLKKESNEHFQTVFSKATTAGILQKLLTKNGMMNRKVVEREDEKIKLRPSRFTKYL